MVSKLLKKARNFLRKTAKWLGGKHDSKEAPGSDATGLSDVASSLGSPMSQSTGVDNNELMEAEVLKEYTQAGLKSAMPMVLPAENGTIRKVQSCPRVSLLTLEHLRAMKVMKSLIKMPCNDIQQLTYDEWSPRPAKRMPSMTEHDSVPCVPCPLPTPRDCLYLRSVDTGIPHCQPAMKVPPPTIHEVCS